MKTNLLFGMVLCQDYLFLGASQVYGWQGSYDKPAFPFGKNVESLLGIKATILGVPGDCLGGSGCFANFPPNHVGPKVTGFRSRLAQHLNSTDTTFEYTIVLGGANDINQKCFFGNSTFYDSLDSELRKITVLALEKSKKILLLPTFNSSLYSGPKCPGLYQLYYEQFKKTTKELEFEFPKRVYFLDSTSLILYQNSFYDDLHLDQQGNFRLAQGLVREILKINNPNPTCQSDRIDCGFMGVSQANCEAAGCCWQPKSNSPWCYFAK